MLDWFFGKKTAEGIIRSISRSNPAFKEWQMLEKKKQQLLDKRAELIAQIHEIDAEIRQIEMYQQVLTRREFL